MVDDQVVWISARATSFTLVCSPCAQLAASEGYGAATVHGWLPIGQPHGVVECPRGHRLRVERELG